MYRGHRRLIPTRSARFASPFLLILRLLLLLLRAVRTWVLWRGGRQLTPPTPPLAARRWEVLLLLLLPLLLPPLLLLPPPLRLPPLRLPPLLLPPLLLPPLLLPVPLLLLLLLLLLIRVIGELRRFMRPRGRRVGRRVGRICACGCGGRQHLLEPTAPRSVCASSQQQLLRGGWTARMSSCSATLTPRRAAHRLTAPRCALPMLCQTIGLAAQARLLHGCPHWGTALLLWHRFCGSGGCSTARARLCCG